MIKNSIVLIVLSLCILFSVLILRYCSVSDYYNRLPLENTDIRLAQEVVDYFNPVHDIFSNFDSNVASKDVFSLDDVAEFCSTMFKHNQTLSNCYFANDQSEFVMVSMDYNGYKRVRIQQKDRPNIVIESLYQNNLFVSSFEQDTQYQAVSRPWYIGASQTDAMFWSSMYIFYNNKMPGVTASFPVYNKENDFLGVFGVDLSLLTLSDLFIEQSTRSQSSVFLFDTKHHLIAHSGDLIFETHVDGSIQPIRLDAYVDNVVLKAVELNKELNKSMFEFDYYFNSYVAYFYSFPDYLKLDYIILYLFEKDELRQYLKNRI